MKKLFATLALVAFAVSAQADYVPTAWGQPMPAHCQNPTFNGIQYVYPATCFKPWAENFVTFWRGIKNQLTPEKTSK